MGNLSSTQVRELIEEELSPSLIEYQYMLSPEYSRKCSYACCKMKTEGRALFNKTRTLMRNNNNSSNFGQSTVNCTDDNLLGSSISVNLNNSFNHGNTNSGSGGSIVLSDVSTLSRSTTETTSVNSTNNLNQSVSSAMTNLSISTITAASPHTIPSSPSSASNVSPTTSPPPLSLMNDEINVVVRVIPKQIGDYGKSNHSIRIALHYSLCQFYNLNQKLLDASYYEDLTETCVLFDGPFIPKQANIPLLYDVYESKSAWFVVQEMYNYTWEELIQFNKVLLETDDIRRRFLFYQLLQIISYCHKNNFAHGKLIPNNILVNEMLWISLIGQDFLHSPVLFPTEIASPPHNIPTTSHDQKATKSPHTSLPHTINISAESSRRKDIVILWQEGKISNFDYLMKLNALAGRRVGDHQYHPVLPWIIDFDVDPTDPNARVEWRDLTKTKFRLTKGDEMLDFTYQSPDNPHHVTEPLSEITYFIYKARRVSISALKKHVRQNYEPKEYPTSLARVYHWTPDECIPEFFTDPNIFTSIHNDMEDLAIPSWASSPEDFIEKHKAALESEYVSQNLHHWIDLIFGYKLSGQHAIEAKNVMLRKENNDLYPSRFGFVQLFHEPHPPRKILSANIMERMQMYECSVKFSSRYFTSSAYHVISILEKMNRTQILSKAELFNDDMFAVGCLLASLYIFEPLFNSRSLERYIRENSITGQQSELPTLKRISQPARSIVEKLIDLNLSKGKKALYIYQSKKYFPEYFKYCHWILSNLYLFQSHLERYNFVLKQIRPSSSPEFSESIMTLPSDALDLLLPHILHMFFVKRIEKSSQNLMFSHVLPWSYGIEILRSMVRYSREKFLSKFKECDSAKKILKLRLYQLYMENERIESFLNTSVEEEQETHKQESLDSHHSPETLPSLPSSNNMVEKQLRKDLLLLPLNLYSYSFSSLVYNVILSDITQKPYNKASQTSSTTYSEGITNPTSNDQKRLFLEQLLPFFIEGVFNNCKNNPQIAKKICTTLSKLCNDFGVIITIQYILDPLILKLKKRMRSYLFDETIFHLLNSLGLNLGYSTLGTYLMPKFFSIILSEMKAAEAGIPQSAENLKTNIFNMIDLLENILERTPNQTSVVNTILQGNQLMINNIMDAVYSLTLSRETTVSLDFAVVLGIFEKFCHFLCRMFHMCDLKIRILIFQGCKSVFRKILSSPIYLEGYFSQQLAVAPSFVNTSKNPIVSSQSIVSTDTSMEEEQSAAHTNTPSSEASKKKGIRSFFERFKRSESQIISDEQKAPELPSSNEVAITSSEEEIISPSSSRAGENPIPEKEVETPCGFRNDNHFKIGCVLYRELCCIFGNSTMREAVLNSKMLEDNITKDRLNFTIEQQQPENDSIGSGNSVDDTSKLLQQLPNKIVYSKGKKTMNEKSSWYVQNQLHSGRLFERHASSSNFDRDILDVKFRGILEYEIFDTKFNDLSLRCIDVSPSDERIILTGGGLLRHHSNPIVKLWNLESSSLEGTYLCYQNTGTNNKQLFRSQVDKVKFISDNRFLCKDSGGNIHLFDVETTKYLYTVGAGAPSLTPELNGTMNFITFETLTNNPNVLVASSYSSIPTVQFYDLRQPSKHCAFEWKLIANQSSHNINMMTTTSSAVIGDHNIRCISKCHPRDNFLVVGLANGVVFLLEQHSGLILDSFRSHENGELTKILPYDGTKPGHFITCCRKAVSFDTSGGNGSSVSGGVNSGSSLVSDELLDGSFKNDLLRVWDTRNSNSSKCTKAFQVSPMVSNSSSQQLDNGSASIEPSSSISNAPIVSFDFYSRPESDQLFAIQPDRILYCKAYSFVSSRPQLPPPQFRQAGSVDSRVTKQKKLSIKKKRDVPIDYENREVLHCESIAERTLSGNMVGGNGSENGATISVGNYTDVKYLPLHKLLLVSTDTGRVKVFS
ncbi:hypothetical protein C9374_005528 [Naegleria lovaniensis]|uniref:BEACH domain-containing protein n=1 Tax=Naegleria lovaniensis TaxID=51637 RepID=A0AA88KN95_NAELO|nr:uncharacterized protein C9374_005528 [Naegleria lovaniensis]KAG2382326.1 hypothetical protein C9374_005528 [Naegleria lovaniensis]